jgi:hypothetical protein
MTGTREVCEKCGLRWEDRDPDAGLPRWPIDPCLGVQLPGVNYFCCGHGKANGAVQFTNGVMIRFGAIEKSTVFKGDHKIFDIAPVVA